MRPNGMPPRRRQPGKPPSRAAERDRHTAVHCATQIDEAHNEVEHVRQQVRTELDAMRQSVQAAGDELSAAQVTVATTRAAAAAAEQAAEREREAVARLRSELDEARSRAQAESQAPRAEHSEQLRQTQRQTDLRVAALQTALEVADRRSTVAAHRDAERDARTITPDGSWRSPRAAQIRQSDGPVKPARHPRARGHCGGTIACHTNCPG